MIMSGAYDVMRGAAVSQGAALQVREDHNPKVMDAAIAETFGKAARGGSPVPGL